MYRKLTVEELEARILNIERILGMGLSMKLWTEWIGRYHALNIKLAHMQGKNPIANYRQSDYII